jgi:hypothetical protein
MKILTMRGLTIIISILFINLLFSCNSNSQNEGEWSGFDYQEKSSKGDWTSDEKESARQWLINEFELNESTEADESMSWVYETVDCLVRRMETHYDNLEEAQFDTEGVGKLGAECGLKYLLPLIKKKNEADEYYDEDAGC